MISEKAKQLYWQGKETLNADNRTIKVDAKAQRLFRKSIEESPVFAEAHFMIGYLEIFTEQYGLKAHKYHWQRARAIARKKDYVPADQNQFRLILDSLKPKTKSSLPDKGRPYTQEEIDELLSAIIKRAKKKRSQSRKG